MMGHIRNLFLGIVKIGVFTEAAQTRRYNCKPNKGSFWHLGADKTTILFITWLRGARYFLRSPVTCKGIPKLMINHKLHLYIHTPNT